MEDAENHNLGTALAAEDRQLMVLLEATRRELRRMEHKVTKLELQVELLSTELEGARAKQVEMERTQGELEERDSNASIRFAELQEQVIRLRKYVSQADSERRTAQKLEEAARSEIMRLSTDNRILKANNEDQARRIHSLDQIIDGYVSSNARIRSDFERLRDQMKR